jgi:ABC-type transport system involved in multi-copper enzyme maturation permease subunit
MFASMLQVEGAKLFRRKLLWVEAAIIAVLIGIILAAMVGVSTVPGIPEADRAEATSVLLWPAGIMVGGSLAASSQLGLILILVLVSALVTQEYGWGTLALLLSRGVSRPVALISRVAVIVLAAVILAVVAVVLGAGASAIFTLITQGAVPLQGADLTLMLKLALGTVLSLLPYIGLALLLSVLSRSAITSIGAGIGFMIAESVISQIFMAIGSMFAKIALYLPMMLGQQFMVILQPGSPSAEGMLRPEIAGLLLVVYGIVFAAIALWQFQKQDLTT